MCKLHQKSAPLQEEGVLQTWGGIRGRCTGGLHLTTGCLIRRRWLDGGSLRRTIVAHNSHPTINLFLCHLCLLGLASQYSLHRADYPPGFLHFFPLSRAEHQTADLESCSKSFPADIVLIPNPVTDDDDDNPDESHKLKHICQAIKLFLYTTGVVRAASHSCGYFHTILHL